MTSHDVTLINLKIVKNMTEATNYKDTNNSILNRQIVEGLLNDYAQQTKIPIAIYENQKTTFSALSSDVFSGFCKDFRDIKQCCNACDEDHTRRALECARLDTKLQMCHIGLWNVGFPIIVDDKHIASLLAGQRLIKGKEKKSEDIFIQRAKELKLSDSEISKLLQSYHKTLAITEEQFNTEILHHLQLTGGYIFQLAEDRINLLKDREALELRTMVLAHEFLLPIQAIIADAANLIDESNEEIDSDFNFIKETSKQILDEMNKLHTIAENMRSNFLIRQPIKLEYKIHSIYRPLLRCWETYNAEANAKNVELRMPSSVSGRFAKIEMSLPNLQRAFMNIIGNAVKYSYSGSETVERYIDIACSQDRGYCIVKIDNFGVGILPDEIDSGKIWEPGYRGRLSRDRSRIGSGLGLPEAKRVICEQHHGTIEVESEFKVTGYKTTIIIKLPIHQPRGEI